MIWEELRMLRDRLASGDNGGEVIRQLEGLQVELWRDGDDALCGELAAAIGSAEHDPGLAAATLTQALNLDRGTPPDSFRSHSLPYIEGERNQLPFRTLGEALADAPEEPDWIVRGMVARTLVTAIGGRPKVGKSTLLFGMLRAVARGESFLGGETVKEKALLLTEERQLTLNEKRNLFALADDDVHVLMRHEALTGWKAVVEEAVGYCLEHELGILAVDTWDKWAELRSDAENNAGDTLANLAPLVRAAGANLAVIVVAHQRKGEGKHGEALRGSNAFAGTVDVILELERDKGLEGGRVLYGTSRLAATPEKVALDWDRDAGVYSGSDYDEVQHAIQLDADKQRVLPRLDSEERTKREIADLVGEIRSERLLGALNVLVAERTAYRLGRGVKGHPYRWRLRRDDDTDDTDETSIDPNDAADDAAARSTT